MTRNAQRSSPSNLHLTNFIVTMTTATTVHPAFRPSKIGQGGRGCPNRSWGDPKTGASAYINKGQTWWRKTWVDSENGAWGEPRTGVCCMTLLSNTRINLPKSERGRGGRGSRGTALLLASELPLSDHFFKPLLGCGFLISLEGIRDRGCRGTACLGALNTSSETTFKNTVNPKRKVRL